MRSESRPDGVMMPGIVLWGTLKEHTLVQVDSGQPVIRVVTDFSEWVGATHDELLLKQPNLNVWITEAALRHWADEDVRWPSARMVVASGEAAELVDIAHWYATKLKAMNISGVFGAPDGILSHTSIPWVGDSLCRFAEQGFHRGGFRVGVAVEDDSHGTRWRIEGADVIPLSLHDTVFAPWYWGFVGEIFGGQRESRESYPVPHPNSVRDQINHMRTQSIHLVDDPQVLPYSSATCFVVKSPDTAIKLSAARVLTTHTEAGIPVVPIWIDEVPPNTEREGVVVAYNNLSILGTAPAKMVKVQVFDNHPVVWVTLREKLIGRSGWFGRAPVRLDGQYEATHTTHYGTEQPHPDIELRWLNSRPLQDTMHRWITSEQQAIGQIRPMIATLERIIVEVTDRYRAGARIFYVGAGSAGRAGVMDAVELPPTFGIPPDRVQAILAGGMGAFEKAQEGEEDNFVEGQRKIASVNAQPTDVVLGISAHGDTPFVLGALSEARNRGCYTIALVNNLGTRIAAEAKEVVFVDSGPEILLGSTRLKAGTVEKVVLNMISTLVMVKMGRSYDNLMIDFKASNDKLRERAVRIFMIATGEPRAIAQDMLRRAHGNLPAALAMQMCGLSETDAEASLTVQTLSTLLGSKKREEKTIHHGSRA
ncbi:MAG: N-acetylmuramic acid 6-phosphate etherase [Firmicutes bacterium]|nr:N-acetylmuramic acid 6-phosphate etherase [Bacillota bacterium]